MIYLVLSILAASFLFVIFKLFRVFNINTLQAIVINYIVAFLFGIWVSKPIVPLIEIPNKPWFLGAVILGLLFIVVFNIMGLTAQKNGLSVASVAGKMSVVIPVLFGILVYHERLGFLKLSGILLAVLAVYLSSVKNNGITIKFKNLLLPILLFIGSGTIDTFIKYVEKNDVLERDIPIFLATIFGSAFLVGNCIVSIQLIRKKMSVNVNNIIGGVALGVVNYYSMEFLLKAFKTDMESSTLFTINNVGVVLLTTIFGMLFFKEKLSIQNKLGILIAIISIMLITFSV